jgi:hypothetical protein
MSLVYCKLRPRLAPVNLTKQTNVTKERVGGASFPSRSLSDNFTITISTHKHGGYRPRVRCRRPWHRYVNPALAFVAVKRANNGRQGLTECVLSGCVVMDSVLYAEKLTKRQCAECQGQEGPAHRPQRSLWRVCTPPLLPLVTPY